LGVFEPGGLAIHVIVKPGKSPRLLCLMRNEFVPLNYLTRSRQQIKIPTAVHIPTVFQPEGYYLPEQGLLIECSKFLKIEHVVKIIRRLPKVEPVNTDFYLFLIRSTLESRLFCPRVPLGSTINILSPSPAAPYDKLLPHQAG
jgi:hypothetical protein